MRKSSVFFVAMWLVGMASAPAQAQVSERFWVDVNLGVAVAAEKEYTVEYKPTVFQEQARFAADYKFPTGADFDFGGGVMITDMFGVGINFSGTAHQSPATVSATIPHPRFFNSPATGTDETADDLKKTEGAVHLQAAVVIPTSDRMRFRIVGGPSYFRVKQDTIDDITYVQNFQVLNPGNVVTITGAPFSESEASAWGYHVGGDFSFFFNQIVGLGAFARFSRAEVDQIDLGGLEVTNKAGGFQTGIGLRLKF